MEMIYFDGTTNGNENKRTEQNKPSKKINLWRGKSNHDEEKITPTVKRKQK